MLNNTDAIREMPAYWEGSNHKRRLNGMGSP